MIGLLSAGCVLLGVGLILAHVRASVIERRLHEIEDAARDDRDYVDHIVRCDWYAKDIQTRADFLEHGGA